MLIVSIPVANKSLILVGVSGFFDQWKGAIFTNACNDKGSERVGPPGKN